MANRGLRSGKEMWFWWFMMVSNCLIPILMIVAGRLMWKHYPKEINSAIGYRTKKSMKNEETWKFGNEYCGRLWYRIGTVILVPTILALIPLTSSSEACIGIVSLILIIVQLTLLVGSIIPTENELKKRFY